MIPTPPLTDDRLTHWLVVRLSDRVHTLLRTTSARLDVSVSHLVRTALTHALSDGGAR